MKHDDRLLRAPGIPAWYRGPLAVSMVLVLVVVLLLALMYAALYVNNGLRAYTLGNRHWAVARMQATHHLEQYIRTDDHAHLVAFHDHLEIPLADRRARLAMESGTFESDTVARHLVAGQNHPEDTSALIRVFVWFNWHERMRRAIDIWEQADEHILDLRALAAEIEARQSVGPLSEEERQHYLAALDTINRSLVPLERAFAESLGEASRWVNTASLAILFTAAALLLAAALIAVRRLTARTFAAEERLRTMFDQAPVGVIHAGLDGRWLEVNRALCRILGYPRERFIGAREEDFLDSPGPGESAIPIRLQDMLSGGEGPVEVVQRYRCANDNVVWLNTSVSLVRDARGAPASLAITAQDVTESRRLSRELSYRARHDSLTGLINRDELMTRLDQVLERVAVDSTPAALCYLDLDQFKVVNDTCGHGAGDAVLVEVSNLMRSCLRGHDTLARFGGDEFVLLFESCTADKAREIAERILAAISSARFPWEGHSFSLGASIGLVPITDTHQSAEKLLSIADAACYTAKESGRNQIQLVEADNIELLHHQDQMHWAQRLQQALEEERFFLLWQPVVRLADIASNQPPRKFEVLLRMRDTDGQVIMPGTFIPAAERYGQIVQLDRWVVDHALSWLVANPGDAENIDLLSINLSGLSISDPAFLASIQDRIQQAPLDPDRICFEITETMMVTNMSRAQQFVQELHQLGCRFALDDFGIGVSSFAYLRALPVDYVKIDGMFVRDIDRNPVHDSIVRCINDVARTNAKQTVAECAESPAIVEKLRAIGCDFVQGYAVGEPVEMGQFEPYISSSADDQ